MVDELFPKAKRMPTTDAMRDRFAGRRSVAIDESRTGVLVSLPTVGNIPGVVLATDGDLVWVWVSMGKVRVMDAVECVPFEGVLPEELLQLHHWTLRFAQVREGGRVEALTLRGRETLEVVEKCIMGVLVARDDGSIVGLGPAALLEIHPPEENA